MEAVAATAPILREARRVVRLPGLSFDGAVRLAEADDEVRGVFERAAHAVGLVIAGMAGLVGPERVLVTGDAMGLLAWEPFEERMTAAFRGQAFGAAKRCRIILRPRPFEQWARGAAAVAVQAHFGLDGAPR